MAQFYGVAGISEYDETTGSSSASSFGINIDPNVSITLVTGEWAATSETNNFNTRVALRDGGGSLQNISYRTWANGTTGSFSSTNTNQAQVNYWNLGAASNTSYTGEHMRTMMWIYNDSNGSIPFQHGTVYGRTSWESNGGYTNDCMYSIKCKTTNKIASLLFLPQAQSFRWFRVNSWSMADT